MNYSKKIYKKDSKGKIRVLHVFTEGADLIQESGLLDGKLIQHRSTCTAKNIGRSNETTPEEQAVLEATSKIETKMSEGYFETIEEIKTSEVILPMLAKDYKKESKKVKFPCYVQPKLDGMRILGAKNKGLISRKGKIVDTLKHIEEELNKNHLIDFFDGEAYAHGKSFQENMTIIKKYRKGLTEEVKFHVYDMIYPELNFKSRYAILKSIIRTEEFKNIELVETHEIYNESELKTWHKKFLSEGYEGTIVRHSEEGYAVNKRSSQLLKYKDFIDIACKIIDVVPSDKNPKQGVVHCELEDGRTFGCGMKFSHTEREEILKNKENYIGKIGEIRFFEYTDDGLPRFPVCFGFREDL